MSLVFDRGSSYVVMPRVLLQEMPEEWQERFVQLFKEYEKAFPNQPDISCRVQITTPDGKLIKTPGWLLDHRYPMPETEEAIEKCRGNGDW